MNIKTSQYKLSDSSRIFPLILIVILSALPSIFSWGRVMIGGDTIIPFNSSAVIKYLYQWIEVQNGLYFSVNYYPLYIFYKIFEFFGFSYYSISLLILFILNFVAGLGIYKLAKLYFNGKDYYSFTIPITFYLLSPALLNSWHYLYIYTFIPWFIFLILGFIKKKEIKIINLVWLNIVIYFSSLDLPNPKYIFYLLIISAVLVVTSFLLKLINFSFLVKTAGAFVVSIFISSYLILPLAGFALNYSPTSYGVSVNPDDDNPSKLMDSGTATVDKMVNLHHNGISINTEEGLRYLKNPIMIILSYLYIFLFFMDILFMKKYHNHELDGHKLMLLVLIIIFLALSVGPNPPFGFIYIYFVNKFHPLAFLRTTAGAVFVLSALYSLYLFILIQEREKYSRKLQILLLIATLITGSPILFGDFYKNSTKINQFAKDNKKYGFTVPSEYFSVASIINNQKLDSKIYYLGSDSSYIYTKWGYFGPPFYSFTYKSNPIFEKTVLLNQAYHNVGLTFVDESIIGKVGNPKAPTNDYSFGEGYVKLYKASSVNFLPHVYVPLFVQTSTVSGNIRSAIYASDDLDGPRVINDVPILEYKKINPTKYRVIIHGAKNYFPLVFSESFNKGWVIYSQTPKISKLLSLDKYKILDGNGENQATLAEVEGFINKGYITNLGDGKNKKSVHKKWESGAEKIDYVETYFIDFISKNFQGTIQNDNLTNGIFYETWLKKPIDSNTHKVVNRYANSWYIDPQQICQQASMCYQSQDGSYNFEIIIEFWPQRLFYIGILISGATLLALAGYSIFIDVKKHKITKAENNETKN